MRSLLAALSFLTRVPVARWRSFDATDVSRSALWFPLIGIVLGSIYAGAAALLWGNLPMSVISILLVALDAVLTGALHFDGLADTADGFGGGAGAEDVLRIMRDHSIGTYGGVALILAIGLKSAAYSALLGRHHWIQAIVMTAALGRWSILLLAATLPYARKSASVIEGMGKGSLVGSTIVIVLCVLASGQLERAWGAAAAVVLVSFCFGAYCRKRIGGITGDTLGANLQLCECATLCVFLWV